MAGIIDTAISGLKLSQLALSVTGQNIVNANTEGYTRQRVNAESAVPQFVGVGYIGSGVTVSQIARTTEQYLIDQVTTDLSVLGEVDQYLANINQIDSLLADPETSIAASMEDYFAALNGVANNPSGLESRQLLLTQTQLLLDRFKSGSTKMLNQNHALNSQLESYARSISTIGTEIAELNTAITSSAGLANGARPNDLLDRRDTLVKELARIVDVDTTLNPDLSMSVFIGEGQGLVIGPQPAELSVVAGVTDPSRGELAFLVNNQPQYVTDQLNGGELGGALRFREEALDPALNALGRIALALTDSVNRQQAVGVDLDGNLGNPIFTDVNDPLLASDRVRMDSRNTPPGDRAMRVTIEDFSQLTTSDYKVVFPGPGQRYSVIRGSDNSLLHQGVLGNLLPDQVSVDGFTIHFDSGSFQAGDNYLIQPTRNGVQNLDVLLRRPEAFAMASPISTETGLGNQGGAFVASTVVQDVTTPSFSSAPGQLSPPVLVRFTSANTYDVLDYSDPANPVALEPPLNNRRFVPGALNAVFPDEIGGSTVSTLQANSALLQVNQASNGYTDETISVSSIDPDTGFVSMSTVAVELNQPARTLAQQLSAIDGVSATASSQLQLFDFTSDSAGVPLGIILNGVDLLDPTLTQGRTTPDPLHADFLRDSINLSQTLGSAGITASSDGEILTVRANSGDDLQVQVTGNGGDSLRLRDGDLRSIVGRSDLSAGYTAPVNSSFDLDYGFGPVRVTLTPGAVNHDQVTTTLQQDVDLALGTGIVEVRRSEIGTIVFEPVDRGRPLTVSNVTGDDVLGISPIRVSGPDIGDQPAVLGGGASTLDPYDFSVQNGSFTVTADGLYSDTLTLSQNYGAGSGAALVAAINAQIQASNGPTGLAGQLTARLDAAGSIELVSTSLGPNAGLAVTAATNMQALIATGTAVGAQLSGTQAQVSGGIDVSAGADFSAGGPHNFMLAVDGNTPVQVILSGRTGIPATFTNTVDISAGVNLLAAPNSFELLVSGHPSAVIDLSGVDTTLAGNPLSSVPPGLAYWMQQQIDAALGVDVVTVGVDGMNRLTLTTAAAGADTSVTVSNPTGAVATAIFPVVGTAVGSEQGGAGVVNLVANAINSSLAAAGQDPIQVGIDNTGVLTISSASYGAISQIEVSDVTGGFGIIFPGSDQGEPFSNQATVGGTIDVQLGANTTLTSNRERGLFGTSPVAIDNYTGYQVYLNSGLGSSGVPVAGDSFLFDFNSDGITDNTNALAMVDLNNQQILSEGNLGLQTAYGLIVEKMGILTSQARISQAASESLLRQSEAALQSVAGVNLDEEAANLIKFEQHYNASAQLVAIARDLFDALLEL